MAPHYLFYDHLINYQIFPCQITCFHCNQLAIRSHFDVVTSVWKELEARPQVEIEIDIPGKYQRLAKTDFEKRIVSNKLGRRGVIKSAPASPARKRFMDRQTQPDVDNLKRLSVKCKVTKDLQAWFYRIRPHFSVGRRSQETKLGQKRSP